MNIRQLVIFKAICDEGGFTKAADKLYMTQPAVSHAIGELERELGTALFDRFSRKAEPNGSGRLFLRKVEKVLELYKELGEGELERQALFRIGSNITIANFWLPEAMKTFRERCPETPVKVEVDSAARITDKLLGNGLDLALIEGVIKEKELCAVSFSSYGLEAVCAPDYPLRTRRPDLEYLSGERLLLREKGSAIRDTWDSALLLQDLYAEPVWTSVNSQALLMAAEAGLGITILPDRLVEGEVRRGALKRIVIKGIRLRNENHVVYHRDKFLTDPMKTLVGILTGER